jgi:multidrug efflux pump subunit AcrB
VQDLQIDNRVSRTQFQYTLEDASADELAAWAPRMIAELARSNELRNVTSDQVNGGMQVSVTIDRDTASRLGVSPQVIDDTLYDAFGQRQISTIFTQLNLYRVILEVKPPYQTDPKALEQLYVRGASGDAIPLSTFVHMTRTIAPLAVNHQGQFSSVTISFDVAEGRSLGSAVDAIRGIERRIGLPPGVHPGFAGAAAAFQTSLASEPLLILAAIITVYIVLGVLYESYIHPLTILSTLPSAGVGALLALILCKSELSVIAVIGIVLLIGIVKKNAIMMIDFALEAERDEKLPPLEAIHKACLLRFRPIMMTTMAALLGGLPLAVGAGTGSELRRPLGISIVGGLLVSQVLTLYTTPVIYLFMDRNHRRIKALLPRAPRVAAEPEGSDLARTP